MSQHLITKVVITGDMHWDNVDRGGIQTVIQNSIILVDMILDKIASASSPLGEEKNCKENLCQDELLSESRVRVGLFTA